MAEWNDFLEGYTGGCPNSFYVLGLGYANPENLGELFSVSNVDTKEEDSVWGPLYAVPYEIEGENGSQSMDETAHLKSVISGVEAGGSFPRSVYLGGKKYQVTQTDVEEVNGQKFVTVMLAAPGCGGAIVKGNTYFVVGLFEEKREQNKGNCRNDTFKVAEAVNAE